MTRIRSWIAENRTAAALWGTGAVVLILVAFVGVAQATEAPTFCNTCHEMKPYYSAWDEGPHSDVDCVDCHVDAGISARLSHKIVALEEVWVHVAEDPKFPLEEAAIVPDARCTACHEDIDPQIPGFSHSEHAGDKPCAECHSGVGHEVSTDALAAAGILNEEAAVSRQAQVVAVRGEGVDNLKNHVETTCSTCHDMEATDCDSCHTPEHDPIGDTCTQCHSPAAEWVFSHPEAADAGACVECHEISDEHRVTNEEAPCESCHTDTGVSWAFAHPTDDPACETCHVRPAEHRTGECVDCHADQGASWAFAHPASSATCTDCHTKPAEHRSGTCTSCHGVGTTWAFSHPSSTSCASCHTRPARHSTSSCSSCHRSGSWAFRHPSSTSCESCHSRPASHSTKACASCHTSKTSWSFAHPGSGSNCTSCHTRPAKHATATCTTCHGVGTSWKFTHPGSGSSCTSCHTRPAKHSTATCTNCHGVGTSWKFSHPGSGSSCTSCHTRPTKHSTATCTTCHGVGTSWAFKHPTSTACSSCHSAPSNHYGTSCSSCHSPSKSWGSATFSHPALREHSYKSFACVNCHPSGYSSATCTSCHGANGPEDDD